MPLACRRANPDCPRGTVPEVVNGCFTDICVSWDDCRAEGPAEVLCGGLLGAVCPEDFYCQYPIEAMCGAGDMQGVCAPFDPNMACTRELFWVCGCDGQSYGNECEAGKAGTSVASVGQCGSEPSICGTRGAGPCDEGEYCNHPIGANCGRSDAPGVCTPFDPTMACTREYFPICGCDGVTYSNPCHADVAGISVDFEGPCEDEGVACTQDGNQCERNEVCFFPDGASCGENGAQGICEVIPDVVCDTQREPVCGCDGMTYSNECVARQQGVSVERLGECSSQCQDDADCAPGGWCRADGAGGMVCTPFQSEGESCGGFTQAQFYTRCAHDLFCYNDEPLLADAPGTCQPLCMSDNDCAGMMTCNITSDGNPDGPCLSSCAPGDPCPDVCYGHCAPTGQQCGGFLGLPCPGGQTCNDAPNDGCDPNNGGADCPGICGDSDDTQCAPGACGPAPRLMQCANGEVPTLDCTMNEAGVCGWEVDDSLCFDEPADCGRDACGDMGWCSTDGGGLPICVPYAQEGDNCGGGLPPGFGNVCNPATHHCAPPAVQHLGAQGTCAAFCISDNECEGRNVTCIVNPPCLSPEGNNLAVCYGYCSSPITVPPREP